MVHALAATEAAPLIDAAPVVEHYLTGDLSRVTTPELTVSHTAASAWLRTSALTSGGVSGVL
jgi:hypothetical protein